MKPKRGLCSALLFLALSPVALACGGDEQLSLREYLLRFDGIKDDANERFEALYADIPGFGTFGSEEEEIQAFREFQATSSRIIEDTIDELEDIDPPAEAKQVHDEALAAKATLLEVSRGQEDRLEDARSTFDVIEIKQDPRPNLIARAAQTRFTDACLSLQRIADHNDIDVDLECEEEEIESLPAELRDCLRRVIGDADSKEAEAGRRLPTEDEFKKLDECLRQEGFYSP